MIKKWTQRSFTLLILLLLSGFSAKAATPFCGWKDFPGIRAKFCYEKPDRPSKTLVVFFHGIYQNEHRWFEKEKLNNIQKSLKSQGLDPWIISISYGTTWILNDEPGSRGLFTNALDKLLPLLIKEIHPQGFTKKYLIGYSMGGFNAAQVLLKRPKTFDKYVLLSPAITTVGPYSPWEDVKDYIWRTKIAQPLISHIIKICRLEFPSEASWEKHSPLELVKRIKHRLPPVYISAGSWDQYGFDEGSYAFYKAIEKKSRMAMWVPMNRAYHSDNDPDSIGRFLLY